jgi:putative ABC transport system ATP-binding protein
MILADEPTGALDELNSRQIIGILRKIADSGKIVIMVTHNLGLISACHRKIIIVDGKISKQYG